MNDEGSLTTKEYMDIYTVLNEYCIIIKKHMLDEPSYVSDVRKVTIPEIEKIIEKMDKRMREYPTDFCW